MIVNKMNFNPIFTNKLYLKHKTSDQKIRNTKLHSPSLSPNISSFSLLSSATFRPHQPLTSGVAIYLRRKQHLPLQPYHSYDLAPVTCLHLALILFLSISIKHQHIWSRSYSTNHQSLSSTSKNFCFHQICSGLVQIYDL